MFFLSLLNLILHYLYHWYCRYHIVSLPGVMCSATMATCTPGGFLVALPLPEIAYSEISPRRNRKHFIRFSSISLSIVLLSQA